MRTFLNKFRTFFAKKGTILGIAILLILFIFILLPIITMFSNLDGKDFSYVFSDSKFLDSVLNSAAYSLVGSVISVVLATVAAYFLSNSNIKYKSLFALILTIPMLIPTLSIGLGIRSMFGTGGIIHKLFSLEIDGLGYPGLIIGAVVSAFPVAFLLLFDAFRYENKNVYDAANTLGISKFKAFIKITLPYLKTPLISAFFASFIWIFSDYGIPMEVAGRVNTLPVYLYEQVLTQYQYGRGAVVGIILIIPAIASFVIDLITKENNADEINAGLIKSGKVFDIFAYVILALISLFILFPQFSFIVIAFVKTFPNDMTFTFNNFINAFTTNSGLGVWTYLGNSLTISFLCGVFGTLIAYLAAYISVRLKGVLGKIIHLICLFSLAVPGLVFGIGYVFLFKNTAGIFYGTIYILVAVNSVHFLASPYIMAKNAFQKINSNYETVGDTINISRFKIFWEVLVPNTFSTLVEMFSFFFINSMITISAVAFLCTYSNQPLSILINTFEKQGSYEMQAVVSFVILITNIIAKVGLSTLSKIIEKKTKGVEVKYMPLTKYQFDFLTFLERKGPGKYTQRYLADSLTFSLGLVNKLINEFQQKNAIQISDDKIMSITETGLSLIEPYRVRKAIVVAAGFGSRMAPVTLKTPKPLVTVNGVRIIDTLLDALYAAGIKSIHVIVGYKKEQFTQLLDKYPTLKFIENPVYNETNNISSVYAARELIDRCYICEADLLIKKPEIITKYQFDTNYLGCPVKETDDWCFKTSGGYIKSVQIGGDDVTQMIGISYWSEKDSVQLRNDIEKVFNSRGGKENYWDNVPLKICKKNYKIAIRECARKAVVEIDNYSELIDLDESYKNFKEN